MSQYLKSIVLQKKPKHVLTTPATENKPHQNESYLFSE